MAIIRALQQLANTARQEGDAGILACIAECILACLANLVEYFNQWVSLNYILLRVIYVLISDRFEWCGVSLPFDRRLFTLVSVVLFPQHTVHGLFVKF